MRKSLLSAVCAVSLAAAATLPSGSQARGITVAVGSSFTTLDPYQATDLLSRTVAKSFYEGLYSFDKNLKPVPQLAESYEVSEDGLVYTFKLRDGVKFHDGTDFTAEAVKLNFERVLNPDNHLSRRSFFNFIGRIEVVDRLHVKFVLSRRTPGFLQRLANGSGQMICPNTIKTMDGRGIAFNPCGTGPYLLKDYNPSERLVVVKNPNYRVKGLPKLDSITWLPVAENASRAAMLRTKEAAFIQPMPVEQVKDIENDPELKLNVVPSIMMRYLSINNAHKPFDDVRVRKAISLAINREALCKVAFSGYARPATGVLPLPIPSAVDLGVPKYDPQEAKRLLAEAGFPNGFSTKLWSGYNNSTSSKVIQFIQQQLNQVGIKTETRILEAGQRVVGRADDLILDAWQLHAVSIPVIRILLQRQICGAGRIAFQHESTVGEEGFRAGAVSAILQAGVERFIDGIEGGEVHQRGEEGNRNFQLHHKRLIVGGGNTQRCRISAVVDNRISTLYAADGGIEHVGIFAGFLADTTPCEHEVRRGYRRSVRPLGITQVEGIRLAVFRKVVAFCEGGNGSTVRIHLHQAVDAVGNYFKRLAVGCQIRVQRHDVRTEHNAQVALLGAGSHAAAGQHHHQGQAQRNPLFHPGFTLSIF